MQCKIAWENTIKPKNCTKKQWRSQKNFSEDHAVVATCYDNLASVYNCLEKNNQAKEFQDEALWFTIRFLVKILPMWQQVIEHNVASVYNSVGDYNQVKEHYDKALTLFRELCCEYHIDWVTGYNVIRWWLLIVG